MYLFHQPDVGHRARHRRYWHRAGAGCTWTAVSQVPWIVITSGASGSGDGSVVGTVEANTTGAARTGTVLIAGLTFTVTQQ